MSKAGIVYVLCVFVEILLALPRFSVFLGLLVLTPIWWVSLIAFVNIPVSLFGFVYLALRTREPTDEEKQRIIELYKEMPPDTKTFDKWKVLDNQLSFAFVFGSDLYISKATFADRYFQVIVAHELGQLQQNQGFFLSGFHGFCLMNLRIKELKTAQQPTARANFLQSLLFGGYSTVLLGGLIKSVFRTLDIRADEFAVVLGLGYPLLAYLGSIKSRSNTGDYFASADERYQHIEDMRNIGLLDE